MLEKDQKTKHLCNRAGFGLTPHGEIQKAKSFFHKNNDAPIEVIPKPELPDPMQGDRKQLLREVLVKSRENMMKVNLAWMEKLRTTTDPLREKMVLFWHDHFACRTQLSFLAQQQNNLLRKHALGNFGAMLMEVSKDPAMLQFLNNQQNRKGHPNENFAREVMELFTLGRGNYTEQDVKEAARAFTGWGFNAKGEFVFREKQHDLELKNFRGVKKNFKGEDIVDSILRDPQTSRFITQKLVTHLVSSSLKQAYVEELAQSFFRSGYNIQKLVNDIFESDWFFNQEFMGNRIKSPVELIVGIQRQTESQFADPQSLIFFQRALGQLLFFPPNVGGWPRGKEWIDSSSLTFRMTMPQLVFRQQETEFQAKDDGDVNSLRERKPKRDFSLNVNWDDLTKQFHGEHQQVYQQIENYLLSQPTSAQNKTLIMRLSNSAKTEAELVKLIFTSVMALPEYQLC